MHPAGDPKEPTLDAGHGSSEQVLSKNGEVVVGVTLPLKPLLHEHLLLGTSSPELLAGHPIAVHDELKYGLEVDGCTVPE